MGTWLGLHPQRPTDKSFKTSSAQFSLLMELICHESQWRQDKKFWGHSEAESGRGAGIESLPQGKDLSGKHTH